MESIRGKILPPRPAARAGSRMPPVSERSRGEEGEVEVLVLADAGPRDGLGHVARSAAVAAGLGAQGLRCRCLALGAERSPRSSVPWEPIGAADGIPDLTPAVLLLDSYHVRLSAVRSRVRPRRSAVFHDAGPLPDGADLTLTTDPRLAGTSPRVLGGPELTCVGPSFWGLPAPRAVPDRLRSILVTTGGGDPGTHAVSIAAAIAGAFPDAEVALVRGPHASFEAPDGVRLLERPQSLLEPLQGADLVVTSAGSSLSEALAVGTPTIALVVAENQRPRAQELARRGATELFSPDALPELVAAVRALAQDPAAREDRVRRGRELIDGYGALRVAFRLGQLARAG